MFCRRRYLCLRFVADEEKAKVSIRYETLGGDGAAFSLTDSSGREVATGQTLGETGELQLTVCRPQLWSPDTPVLYKLTGSVLKSGRATDVRDVRIGLRTIRFDGNTGFYLNGQSMKLKGVCVHHDAVRWGWPCPKRFGRDVFFSSRRQASMRCERLTIPPIHIYWICATRWGCCHG